MLKIISFFFFVLLEALPLNETNVHNFCVKKLVSVEVIVNLKDFWSKVKNFFKSWEMVKVNFS